MSDAPAGSSPANPIPAARPVIDEADIEAAVRVLRSGMVVQGPEVKGFEDEFSQVVGGVHCVAVNSGTSANIVSRRIRMTSDMKCRRHRTECQVMPSFKAHRGFSAKAHISRKHAGSF